MLIAESASVSLSRDAQNGFKLILFLLFVPPLVGAALATLQISVVPLAIIVQLHRTHHAVATRETVARVDIYVLAPETFGAVIFETSPPERNKAAVTTLKIFDFSLQGFRYAILKSQHISAAVTHKCYSGTMFDVCRAFAAVD